MRTVIPFYTIGSTQTNFGNIKLWGHSQGHSYICGCCRTHRECHGIFEHHCGSFAALHGIRLMKWERLHCAMQHSMSHDWNCSPLVPET